MRLRRILPMLLLLPWFAQAGRRATAVAVVTNGSVARIVVVDGGDGYAAAPSVIISGGGGSGAVAVASLTGGSVSTVTVSSGGAGFTNAPTIVVSPPPEAATVTVEMVPKLTINGALGSAQRVQWSPLVGSGAVWSTLTNVVLSVSNVVTVDLTPGASGRFYRVIAEDNLVAPEHFGWVPAGTFVQGSTATEPGHEDDEAAHSVTFSEGFWIGRTEVTQAQYRQVMGVNPSARVGDKLPVESVSWADAVLYCATLTASERSVGRLSTAYEYRLPTEAEWEYAGRGGTTTLFPFGADATVAPDYAWFAPNSGGQTQPVAGRQPNGYGFHDFGGNVWEWCSDWYGAYPASAVNNPEGPDTGTLKVIRGGSLDRDVSYLRSARRAAIAPDRRRANLGFRVVLARVQ